MITKKTVYVVSHDDPLANEFCKALKEDDSWEMEYDTQYAVYTKTVAIGLGERKEECQLVK